MINNGLNKESWKRRLKQNFKALNATSLLYKHNYNDILASIAIPQFKKIDKVINFRKKLYKRYINNFKFLFKNNLIKTQYIDKKNVSSLYCFQIVINSKKKYIRDRFAYFLEKKGITTTVYYTPAHMHHFYKRKLNSKNQKITNELFSKSLALPFHNKLNLKDIDKVSKLVTKFIRQHV